MSTSVCYLPSVIELLFHIEQDEGWLIATCHDPEMATQAETLEALVPMIRDLIQCRFDEDDPKRRASIRLHFLKDPVLEVAS